MRRIVLAVVVHADDDAEEHGDCWHDGHILFAFIITKTKGKVDEYIFVEGLTVFESTEKPRLANNAGRGFFMESAGRVVFVKMFGRDVDVIHRHIAKMKIVLHGGGRLCYYDR